MRNGETAYLVWYNDGEQYEDNFQDVMGVFASYDDAVAWIEAEGFVKDDSDSKFWKRDDGFYPTEYCSIREFEVGGREKGPTFPSPRIPSRRSDTRSAIKNERDAVTPLSPTVQPILR